MSSIELAEKMYKIHRKEIIEKARDQRGAALMYPEEFDIYNGDHKVYVRWAKLALQAVESTSFDGGLALEKCTCLVLEKEADFDCPVHGR